MSGIIGKRALRGPGIVSQNFTPPVTSVSGSTGVVADSDIDHDSLANFAANEHYTQANITALGTVTTGTLNSSVEFPVGHIIQHEFLNMTTEDGTANTSDFESSGFGKAITPLSASSKIFILVIASVNHSNEYYLDIHGTTNGLLGNSVYGLAWFQGGNPHRANAVLSFVDTPGVIVAETYTIYHKVSAGSGYINATTGGDGSTGIIHLFEIVE